MLDRNTSDQNAGDHNILCFFKLASSYTLHADKARTFPVYKWLGMTPSTNCAVLSPKSDKAIQQVRLSHQVDASPQHEA